jgi:putative transposase
VTSLNKSSVSETESLSKELDMPMKRYKPEQIVMLLRQIEVEIANGKTTPQACKEAEITVQTFYCWRKEFSGLKLDQAKRLKELERENGKLKRLVAELSLEKQVLKDIAEGNF